MLLERGTTTVAEALTDADGRIARLGEELPGGRYRLVFETGEYLQGRDHVFERVSLEFELAGSGGHHHLPLLLSPYGISSYRGS